jgi:hypothetical protein
MKLCYRGTSYENKPSNLEIREGEIGGKYRGQDWKIHYPRHIPQLQPQPSRQYRGITYSNSSNPIPKIQSPPIIKSESMGVSCAVPIRKKTAIVINQTQQIHLENIRRRLESRLQVAKANGDEDLIYILEQEYRELALF